jgi:hypothetical protein
LGRWRDREFSDHYWLANDLGKGGELPSVLPQMIRDIYARGQIGGFHDLFSHRSRPSQVLTPARLVGAAIRMLRQGADRRTVMKEVGSLIAQNARRELLKRRPAYATLTETARDAGATEVEQSAVET